MAQFFDYPLNYGGSRSQYKAAADNDYATYTDQTSMLLHIDATGDGSGTARDFTDIFVKGTGISTYTAAFTNGANIPTPSPFPRTPPTTVKNDSGDNVPTVIDGYQHDLHSLWTDENTEKPKAKSVTLTFAGTNIRVYAVMILDRLLTLNSDGGFSRIEYDSLSLGTVESDLKGNLSYVPPLGGTRDKWLVNLTLLSRRTQSGRDTIADDLMALIRKHKSFVFAPEYHRHPDRVYPALWPNPETQIRYLAKLKGAGRRVLFSVREA